GEEPYDDRPGRPPVSPIRDRERKTIRGPHCRGLGSTDRVAGNSGRYADRAHGVRRAESGGRRPQARRLAGMGRGGRRDRLNRYTVYVTPAALREAKGLPGNARQRTKRAIGDLADNPRPPDSKALSVPEVEAEVR